MGYVGVNDETKFVIRSRAGQSVFYSISDINRVAGTAIGITYLKVSIQATEAYEVER